MIFKNIWEKHFNGIPMLGWKLRIGRPDLWFRIHSLPDSKRYPETAKETEVLIGRHNEIATEVLGEEQELFLYWHWIQSFHGIDGIQTMEYEDEDFETTLFAANVGKWKVGKFSELILAVANDEFPQIVFLNTVTGNVYAP